jgi:hypothetical protein
LVTGPSKTNYAGKNCDLIALETTGDFRGGNKELFYAGSCRHGNFQLP